MRFCKKTEICLRNWKYLKEKEKKKKNFRKILGGMLLKDLSVKQIDFLNFSFVR